MAPDETISDLVVLGRTGPESISGDRRNIVCLGGYSETHGFIRIFPTRMDMDTLQQWNVVSVPVERPEKDPRDESWKIAGSKREWRALPEKVEQVGRLDYRERVELVQDLAGDCANTLNEEKRSMGVVEPAEIHSMEVDESDKQPVQVTLGGRERPTKRSYPKLYAEYNCVGCAAETRHRQHITDWELYRYWDTNDDVEGAIPASRILDDGWKHYFLVGNLRDHQTAFIIGSLIRFKRSKMLDHDIRPGDQTGLVDF